MKAIKPRPDVGPKTRVPNHFIVDDELWDEFIAQVQLELDLPLEEVAVVEHDIDGFAIDGGGMVSMNDPKLEVDIDGCVVHCYGRQVEFFLPALRNIKSGRYGQEYVSFGGRWWAFLFTVETAKRIADELEQQAEDQKEEIDQTWDTMEKDVAKVKNAKMIPREDLRKAYKEIDRREQYKNN